MEATFEGVVPSPSGRSEFGTERYSTQGTGCLGMCRPCEHGNQSARPVVHEDRKRENRTLSAYLAPLAPFFATGQHQSSVTIRQNFATGQNHHY